MKSLNKIRPAISIAALALAMASGSALADAQINFGDTWLGINDEGHLNISDAMGITTNTSNTGLTFQGNDATSPGCLCEGWGVAASGSAMWASVDTGGVANMVLGSFASTASTATSLVSMSSLAGLSVTHHYQPSAAGNVFEAIVTISNDTGGAITDVRYTRAMDWDIAPNEFNEYVTIAGTATTAALLYSGNNGFLVPNPLGSRTEIGGGCGETVDFTDCGPQDHGAIFDFGFGDLADGESVEFSIFYGGAESESGALSALGTIGAELFSLGQWSGDPTGGGPATYLFAFTGVGGTPVIPMAEPTVALLFGIGLAGLGFSRRKKA